MFLIFLALIVVACMKRRAWGRQASWSWDVRHRHHRHDEAGEPDSRGEEERFEEWHRTMHTREHEADDNERV